MLLVTSLAALLVAPLIFKAIAREARAGALLDGFVVVAVSGLVCLHVLPEAIGRGGWLVGAAAVVGLALPGLLERVLHRLHASVHRGTVLLVAVGLALHAFFDGLALSAHGHGEHAHAHGGGHDHLGLAVVFHRLPEALLIWSVARPVSRRFAWALLSCIGVATLGGFFAPEFTTIHVDQGWALVDGLVAGALLHVALAAHGHWQPHADAHGRDAHRRHDHAHHGHAHHHAHHDHAHPDHAHHDHAHHDHAHHDHAHHAHAHHDHAHHTHAHHDHDGDPPAEEAEQVAADAPENPMWSAIGAVLAVGMLAVLGGVDAGFPGDGLSFVDTFVTLAFESAPALLFAFVGAGLVRAFLAPGSTAWISRGPAALQATKGMAFGLPLPVCSCGVLPLYEGLVRAGVPTTAGVAFLIATPELGLDAILISIPLLGGELTLARIAAAAVVALLAALLIGRLLPMRAPVERSAATPSIPRGARLRAGLRFGLVDLVDHTLPWVVLGLGVAAVCEPVLAHAGLRALPAGVDVLLFALIGAPLYVCATGATPLAAVLIHAGVSPGAALAFLLTGPATNLTTFGVLARLHGRRGAALFGIGVLGLAVGVGLLVNLALPAPLVPPLHQAAASHASPLQVVCLAALGLLLLGALFRQGPRGIIRQITDAVHVH